MPLKILLNIGTNLVKGELFFFFYLSFSLASSRSMSLNNKVPIIRITIISKINFMRRAFNSLSILSENSEISLIMLTPIISGTKIAEDETRTRNSLLGRQVL